MNAAEFNAAFPEPQSILGLRLLPLSLGRYKLLKRFESPFVDDEKKEVGLQVMNRELFFALIVCGLECEEFKNLFQTNGLKKELSRWGDRLGKIVNVKGFNILVHITAFKKYLTRESSIPWVILEVQDARESSQSHWSTSVESVLRSKMNWTTRDIDEKPLTDALAQYWKFMESEGFVRLYDPEYYESVQDEAEANAVAMDEHLKRMEQEGGT